jgi:cytochrome b561
MNDIQVIEPNQYDRRTILLHWLVAILIAVLWVAGQCIDFSPKGTPRIMFRSLHISLGFVLGLIWFYRIYWRAFKGVRLESITDKGLTQFSRIFHKLLYVLIGLLVLSGLAAVWIRGDNLFDLWVVPAFDPGNKALRRSAVELHEWLANGLLFAALMHILAAFWHHYKLKDGLLNRMSWFNHSSS